MKNVMKLKKETEKSTRSGLKTALCEALFSYVLEKTGIFPKGMQNKCLFWANY
jgi:hypothetical protein